MKFRYFLAAAAVLAVPAIPVSQAAAADKFVFTAIPTRMRAHCESVSTKWRNISPPRFR